MTVNIMCDWCARPIDESGEFTAEEYNRMGFEDEPGDRHVVVESRFDGCDRRGRAWGSTELWHFHKGACYYGALGLIRDHRTWAESQNDGPRGAKMPKWTGERLEAPADVVGGPTKSRPGNRASASAGLSVEGTLILEKIRVGNQRRKAGTPLAELGIPTRAVHGLERSDVYTLEELVERTEQEVRAVDGVGYKTMRQLTGELTRRGVSLREGRGIADEGVA